MPKYWWKLTIFLSILSCAMAVSRIVIGDYTNGLTWACLALTQVNLAIYQERDTE